MNKEIYRLAVPNIITNITIPILGMVDLSLLGHLDSPVYLGAVSIGAMIFNILYWGMNFIRMSTTGFTSQAYGEGDTEKIAVNLFRPLIIAFSIGFVLILLKDITQTVSFNLLQSEAETEKLAASYFNIRIWAAPASLSLYGFYGWFIGMQNSRYPFFIAIFINIVNIALSYFFIYHLNMKSDGAALGTVAAQYSGVLLSMLLLFKKYRKYLNINFFNKSFNKKDIVGLFKVNTNIFIRTLGIMLVFTFFTASSANKSTLILDTNTVLFQFYIFFTYFIDGFAYATEALSGKYKGKKDYKNFMLVIKKIFFISFVVSVLFSVIYVFFGDFIIQIMTGNKQILELSQKYIFWVYILPVLSFAAFIWDGVFVGTTMSKEMRNTMLASSLLVFFPVYYLFEPTMGNNALWLALILFLTSRGVFQTFVFLRKIKIMIS